MTAPGAASSLRRNAAWNVAGRVISAALWVLTTPVVLHALGPERFAVWALCFALTGYVAALDFGIGNAVARHVALEVADADFGGVRRTVRNSVLVALGLGLVWATAGWFGRDWLIARFHVPAAAVPEAHRALGLYAVALMFGVLSQVLQGLLMGLERLDRFNLAFLAGVAVHTALLVTGLIRGGGLVAAAVGAISGQLTQLVLGALLSSRLVAWRAAGPPHGPFPWRAFAGFGAAVQGTNATATGWTQTPRILLGILGNLRAVTELELGMRLSMTVWSVAAIMQGALIGTAARVSASGSVAALREVYVWTSRWMVALASWALGGLWLLAPAVLVFWLGPGHETSILPARDTAIAFAVIVLAGPAMALARGSGWPVLETIMSATALALQVGFGLWLIPRIGARGAPLALGASVALAGAWLVTRIHARIELSTVRWLAGIVLPRLGAAAVAVALTSFVPMAPAEGRGAAFVEIATRGAIYSIVYALLTWYTGDVRSLATRLGLRLPAPRGVAT